MHKPASTIHVIHLYYCIFAISTGTILGEISIKHHGGATLVGAPSQSPFRVRLSDERRTRLVTQMLVTDSPAAGNEGGGVFLLNSDPGKITASELQGLIDRVWLLYDDT